MSQQKPSDSVYRPAVTEEDAGEVARLREEPIQDSTMLAQHNPAVLSRKDRTTRTPDEQAPIDREVAAAWHTMELLEKACTDQYLSATTLHKEFRRKWRVASDYLIACGEANWLILADRRVISKVFEGGLKNTKQESGDEAGHEEDDFEVDSAEGLQK